MTTASPWGSLSYLNQVSRPPERPNQPVPTAAGPVNLTAQAILHDGYAEQPLTLSIGVEEPFVGLYTGIRRLPENITPLHLIIPAGQTYSVAFIRNAIEDRCAVTHYRTYTEEDNAPWVPLDNIDGLLNWAAQERAMPRGWEMVTTDVPWMYLLHNGRVYMHAMP